MADDATPEAAPVKQGPLAKVGGELLHLSPWKKKLLGLFAMIGVIGGGLWTHAVVTSEPPPPEPPAVLLRADATPPPSTPPSAARGFVDADEIAVEPDAEPVEDVQVDEEWQLPWTGRLGGWLARFGLSFAVGLVAGVFFRSFLKTMAVITAVAIGAIVGLSYFEVLPIDFTTMRANFSSAGDALRGHAETAKDFVIDFLPSATAATFGFFVGFLRR
jgi:uncharacterized membrane protein (Fun14 family)